MAIPCPSFSRPQLMHLFGMVDERERASGEKGRGVGGAGEGAALVAGWLAAAGADAGYCARVGLVR